MMSTTGFSGTNRTLAITLFVLIAYIMFAYIFRYVAPNFEPALGLIFLIALPIFFRHRLQGISQSVKIWMLVLLVYWLLTAGTTMLHSPLGERSMLAINIASLCLGFAMLSYLLERLKPSIDFFWYLIGFGSLLLAVIMGMEMHAMGIDKVLEGIRVGGTYNHRGRLGIITNAFFLVSMGALPWAYKKGKLFFTGWCLLIMFDLTLVILGQSRKAWLGLPVVIIGWGLYYGFMLLRSNASRYIKGASLVIPVIIFVMLATLLPIQTVIVNRISNAYSDIDLYISGNKSATPVGHRLVSYEIAINSITDKPLFGIGEDAFPEFQREGSKVLVKKKFNQDIEGYKYNHIHNQFLMAWLTKGIFAFIAIVGLFIYLLVFLIRGIRHAGFDDKPIWIAGLIYTLASILIFSMTTPLHNSASAGHFFLILSLMVVFSSLTTQRQSQGENRL